MFLDTILPNYIVPCTILLTCVVDDLRSKKIHNQLILTLLAMAITFVVTLGGGLKALAFALGKMLFALGLSLPLTLTKVIGGGDMKLYAVLALVIPLRMLVITLICAFFWGALLGVIKVILDKKTGLLYANLLALFKLKKPSADTLHGFPFSVSLFLGYLSAFYWS